MSSIDSLETKLDEVFTKNAPSLPANAKKWLVQYIPWINLVIGVLSLLSALSLWNWAHVANNLINYANSLSTLYGGEKITTRLTFMIWISLAILVVQALLYIAAFPGLRDRKKSGWNLLFYALLVNLVYGVVIMFTSYGGPGNLIGSLIGFAIGAYFLFQIRSSYKAAK